MIRMMKQWMENQDMQNFRENKPPKYSKILFWLEEIGHKFEYSKEYKYPRVYFGRNITTHTWDLWIVEWNGESVIFQDLKSLDEVINLVNQIPEKYPKYVTKTIKEVTNELNTE